MATYIGTFFMYLRIVPIEAETQPIIPCLFLFLAIPFGFNKILEARDEELFLLLFCWVVLCYLFYGLSEDNWLRNCVYAFKILFCPLLYLFVLKSVEYVNISHVRIVVYTLLCFCISSIVYVPALTEITRFVIKFFLPRFSFGEGVRGISILTAEPSYFVYFGILSICTLDFIKLRDSKTSETEIIILKAMIIFMGGLTRSALVYVFILYYTSISLFFSKKHLTEKILIFIFIVFFCGMLLLCTNNRLIEIFENIIASKDIFDVLFYSDASGGFRALFNCLYYLSILVNPFGFGLGEMSENWFVVANYFDINPFINTHLANMIEDINNIDAQAYIPNVIGNVGVFSWLLILFVFKRNSFGDLKFKTNVLTTLIVFMFVLQSNYVNPVFWFLLAFIKYKGSTKSKHLSCN